MTPVKEWIHTHCGVKFIHRDPKPQDILIEDIAHSLSNLCRFAGHTKVFYSVAEHSVRVSYLCKPPYEFEGLMHDSPEAYVVDMPRPLKYAPGMEPYRAYEKLSERAIRERFNMLPVEPKEVKDADIRLLYTEKRDLLTPGAHWSLPKLVVNQEIEPLPLPIDPWTPEQAKIRFLMRYYELTGTDEFYQRG